MNVYIKNAGAIDTAIGQGLTPEEEEFFMEPVSGRAKAIDNLKASFQAYCIAASVVPASLHVPWGGQPYSGSRIDDFEYDISTEEYERWASRYLQQTAQVTLATIKTEPLPGLYPIGDDKPPLTSELEHEANSAGGGGRRGQKIKTMDGVAWQERAQEIANDLHKRDINAGAFSTPTAMAERVAPIMRERGIFGPQGPLAATTILREALSKRHWKRLN